MTADLRFTLETADALAEAYPALLDLDSRVKGAVAQILAGEPVTPGKLGPDLLPCNAPDAEFTMKSLAAAGMHTAAYVQALSKSIEALTDECATLAKAIPTDGVSVTLPAPETVKALLERGEWQQE